MLKAVLIDDHSDIRIALRKCLSTFDNVKICGEAGSVVEGLKLIRSTRPSLVFLDVEMGDGTGFDLLSLLEEKQFHLIFVTSHDEFALKAFKFSAIDYLLKPVQCEEVVQAVDRVFEQHNPTLRMEALLDQHLQKGTPQKIILSDQQNTYLVEVKTIIRCEGMANYTTFFLDDGKQIMVSKPLKFYENALHDHGFLRTHQSHLLNIHFFDRYDRSSGLIYLKNGDTVPIATRKKDALNELLATFLK